jgi:hypothetical protein
LDKAEVEYIEVLKADPEDACAMHGLTALAEKREGNGWWRSLRAFFGPLLLAVGGLLASLVLAAMAALLALYIVGALLPQTRWFYKRVPLLNSLFEYRLRVSDFSDIKGDDGRGQRLAALVRSEIMDRHDDSSSDVFIADDAETLALPPELLEAAPQLKFISALAGFLRSLIDWTALTVRGHLVSSAERGEGVVVFYGSRGRRTASATFWAPEHASPPPPPAGKIHSYESLAVPIASWVLREHKDTVLYE